MIDRIKNRLAKEESGFTLIELLVVMIILAILMAIAIPSYLGFRDRANKSAAQSNLRSLVPSVEAYSSDNTGTSTDADGVATTTGYQGIDMTQLKKIDNSLDAASTAYTFPKLTASDYCITNTVSGWTAFKNGPAGAISVKPVSGSGAYSAADCA
jgi:prepilin-type N-terminal cleavage/methylation domain-containing protein